jgi:serine/threonine protein phosphatase PrpC
MLLGDINYTYAHRMYEQRRGALTERFAHDCSITAALLRDVIAEDRLAPGSDDEQAAALGRALRREGFSFESVSVFGGERYTAVIEGCGALDADGVNKLHDIAQRISGRTLSVPHYDEDANGCYRLQAIPRIQARGVFRSLAASNSINEPQGADSHSAVCGDSMRLFSDGSGAYYALLCDGMGSGASAALTSGCCVMLLERLLRAGVGIDTAMGLLNHYLISRTDSPEREITSTVDLLALDLYGEKAKFIKSGAADTLILRRGMLYSVSCHTLPLGILQTLDVQAVPFALEDGDCIFMMSDGVTEPSDGQNEQACERLYELLTAAPPPRDDTAATALLEHILAQARATGAKDDLTVALIRIESQ